MAISLTSLVGVTVRLALDIARKFMFGAFDGIFTEASGSSIVDCNNGVGGGGNSGVGHVTMFRIGDGGGGKVEA